MYPLRDQLTAGNALRLRRKNLAKRNRGSLEQPESIAGAVLSACFSRPGSARHRAVLGETEQTALRLGAALIVGSVLGLNRELHGKAAGLRTHALVCVGSAVSTIIACGVAAGFASTDLNAVSRVVQGILTGVGFIGAGVILRDPMGHVTGLTTAATIWICAVLGIVCGLGYWSLLGIAAILTTLLLVLGRPVERLAEKLFHRHATEPPDHSV